MGVGDRTLKNHFPVPSSLKAFRLTSNNASFFACLLCGPVEDVLAASTGHSECKDPTAKSSHVCPRCPLHNPPCLGLIICTAACLGLFPFPFARVFPKRSASPAAPKAQQDRSQQPGRADDIPTAFPGKHLVNWNESNSKGRWSQAYSTHRGFFKMCQFI